MSLDLSIRVYGFYLNSKKELLIANEYWYNTEMLKLPGGGLEKGEGIATCLKREWIEELNQPIRILKHIYTTDFYYISQFHHNKQVICVYYQVEIDGNQLFEVSKTSTPIKPQNGTLLFKYMPINKLSKNFFTFKSDQIAFEKFCKKL